MPMIAEFYFALSRASVTRFIPGNLLGRIVQDQLHPTLLDFSRFAATAKVASSVHKHHKPTFACNSERSVLNPAFMARDVAQVKDTATNFGDDVGINWGATFLVLAFDLGDRTIPRTPRSPHCAKTACPLELGSAFPAICWPTDVLPVVEIPPRSADDIY